MKKRYSIIFTITAAAVLVSSIAYASKKKLQAKSERVKQDMSEVDLATNLLDADGERNRKSSKVSDANKMDGELQDLTVADKPKVSGVHVAR